MESLSVKTHMVRMLLLDHIVLECVVRTVVDAQALAQKLMLHEPDLAESQEIQEQLFGKDSIRRHMLLLDSSLDTWTSDMVMRERGAAPEEWAAGLATDESPPNQNLFGGYRFQVTCVYTPLWRPKDTWDDSDDPPLDTMRTLLDICHCPGKTGADVMKVLDMPLARVGMGR